MIWTFWICVEDEWFLSFPEPTLLCLPNLCFDYFMLMLETTFCHMRLCLFLYPTESINCLTNVWLFAGRLGCVSCKLFRLQPGAGANTSLLSFRSLRQSSRCDCCRFCALLDCRQHAHTAPRVRHVSLLPMLCCACNAQVCTPSCTPTSAAAAATAAAGGAQGNSLRTLSHPRPRGVSLQAYWSWVG